MLGKLFGRSALDTRRFEATIRDYDEVRGYGDWHRRCQAAYDGPADLIGPLDDQGVERVRVLEPARAADALDQLRAASRGCLETKSRYYSERHEITDRALLDGLFGESFSGPLDAKITNWLASHYMIFWWNLSTAMPRRKAERAFLWHCDSGPSRYLNLLIYLNPTAEHGGGTEFLDRSTTDAIAESGYIFGPTRKRKADLANIARAWGIAIQPIQFDLDAGEGILFQPSRVLHKGLLPDRGERWTLAFCLLPSPVPWRIVHDRTGSTGPAQDYSWFTQAQALEDRIGQANCPAFPV